MLYRIHSYVIHSAKKIHPYPPLSHISNVLIDLVNFDVHIFDQKKQDYPGKKVVISLTSGKDPQEYKLWFLILLII